MTTVDRPALILIDGATGAGKSTLLADLRKNYAESVLVGTKLTTRAKRVGDNDWEFRFAKSIAEGYSKYRFHSVGNDYAVDHKQLALAIDRGFIYAISLVDSRVVRLLNSRFQTVIIYVYRPLDTSVLEALLTSRGDDASCRLRREEIGSIGSHYLEMIELCHHVILNLGSETDMCNQLAKILELYGIQRD
jgi:guanylate kinase